MTLNKVLLRLSGTLLTFVLFAHPSEAVVENNRIYGFLYWENGVPTQYLSRRPESQANLVSRAEPDLVIQTGYYSLVFDADDIQITGYDALAGSDYLTALHQDVTVLTPAQQFNLFVYKDGKRYTCTSGIPLSGQDLQGGDRNTRLIESGQFVQRFDHTALIFEDDQGNDLGAMGRLEITAWPDHVVFYLDLSEVPGVSQSTIELISPAGRVHRVDAMGDRAYLAIMPHLDQDYSRLNASDYITYAKVYNSSTDLNFYFDEQEYALHIDFPTDPISFPENIDRVDQYVIEVTNPGDSDFNIPLVFNQVTPGNHITGTVLILTEDTDGAPTGLPMQHSKNWHAEDPTNPKLHEGPWFRGSTMFTLAPGESTRLRLKAIYGHWAGVPAASHAQLSLIGWGNNWQWDESALGSWGENMTFDPYIQTGASVMCDIRPQYTINPNDPNDTTHSWNENSGGGDFLVYYDANNTYHWPKRLKTAYRWSGPNLTEVIYSGVSDDDKIRFTYKTLLPRTYDYHRRIQEFTYEFLQDVDAPRRLVFYQMAADYYPGPLFYYYYRSDSAGGASMNPSFRGGDEYKDSFAFDGRWLAVDDIESFDEVTNSNRGIILRRLRLNGRSLTPYIHLFGGSWGGDRMFFDLSSHSVRRSYSAGDVVEGRIDFIMPPKSAANYWGLDSEFGSRLSSYGLNPWRAVSDEYRYNDLNLTIHTGSLTNTYPIEIDAGGGDVLADVTINGGGLGHVPIIVTSVDKGEGVSLQRYVNGGWQWLESVNVTENDYYQGYQNAAGKIDYTFTVHRPDNDLATSWRIRVLRGTDGVIDTENDPPEPNPATFALAPVADSESVITMTATTGTDVSIPVEYLFTETSGNPGGTSSGWQTSSTYTDTGLLPNTTYTYTVTMRDGLLNTGEASSPASATTPASSDTDPPTPNPATFAIPPAADSDTSISMTATTGTDAHGPVEYYFDEISGNPGGIDSGWQTSPSYTNTGLRPSTQYTYTVQLRDIYGNTGMASAPANAATDSEPGQAPYTTHSFPGTVQCEDYDYGGEGIAYHDTDPGNTGGYYRSDDVDITTSSDIDAGYTVGWIYLGEWWEYTISNVASGTYDIELRVASGSATPGDLQVTLDGQVLGTFPIETTGGWYSWTTLTLSNVTISGRSNQLLRLDAVNGGGFNINWINFQCDLPSDPTGLTIARVGDDLQLTWDDAGVAGMTWNVYRNAGPDPTGWGGPHQSGVTDEDPLTPGVQDTDPGAATGNGPWFYLVTAVTDCESPLR